MGSLLYFQDKLVGRPMQPEKITKWNWLAFELNAKFPIDFQHYMQGRLSEKMYWRSKDNFS